MIFELSFTTTDPKIHGIYEIDGKNKTDVIKEARKNLKEGGFKGIRFEEKTKS